MTDAHLPDRLDGLARELLTGHGIAAGTSCRWASIRDGLADARLILVPHSYENAVYCQQLDVHVSLQDGRTLIESFAGVGPDENSSVLDGVQNFAAGSFHVLLSAFYGMRCHDQVELENWVLGPKTWMAHLGPVLTREFASDGNQSRGPDVASMPLREVIDSIKTELARVTLEPTLHWLRIYLMRGMPELCETEVLLDNNPFEPGIDALRMLDHSTTGHVYSHRIFLMLEPTPVAEH